MIMSHEFLRNLSEEEASKLMEQVIRRLPYHGGRIGSAVMEVLECPLPEGVDMDTFNANVFGDALRIVGENSGTTPSDSST